MPLRPVPAAALRLLIRYEDRSVCLTRHGEQIGRFGLRIPDNLFRKERGAIQTFRIGAVQNELRRAQ